MKIIEKIDKFLNKNNPERIANEIAQSYQEKKENGEEHPMDDTVEEIMQIFQNNPDLEKVREILKNILEKKDIPNRIFEKTATKISQDEKIPDSVITEVVAKSDVDVADETINNIINEGEINLKERLKLLKNVENKNILEKQVSNELEILYRNCKDKRDAEVAERVTELKEILDSKNISDDLQDLIQTVVAKKMAENIYSDTSKGTNIYTLSKIMPVEDMFERDLVSTVEREYNKIEDSNQPKEGRFKKQELKIQILIELAKKIAIKYEESGIFVIPQSDNMKKINEEEEKNFIRAIQTYSRKDLSRQEVVDIDEQVRGKSDNIQLKEDAIVGLLKKIPEQNKKRSMNSLINILKNRKSLETLSMLEENGLIQKLNELPEEKRNKTIETIKNTMSKRKYNVAEKIPKIKKQKIETYTR